SGASLVKSGAGTLTIANAGNDFTGTVTISGGTLVAGNEYSLGSTAGGTIIDGGTLDFNGKDVAREPITVKSGGALVNNNDGYVGELYYVTLTGDATFGGAEDWVINGYDPDYVWEDSYLQGDDNYTLTKVDDHDVELLNLGDTGLGNVNVNAGSLTVSMNTNLGGAGTLNLNGGTLVLNDNTVTQTKALAVTATGGTIQDREGDGTLSGNGLLSGELSVIVDAEATLTLSGVLDGTGGLTKMDNGRLVLGGMNTYEGDTQVLQGTLELVTGGDIDPDSLIENESALEVSSGAHIVGVIEGTGTTAVVGGASLTATSITQGTLVIGGGGAAAAAAPVPEPGTWLLLLIGLLGMAGWRSRFLR
ncbi:MAG: autotransporter-associated beta strand repeat-containing protein, partial [Pirellulales bacterium]|nr:autotransporter-associated beta strand repeat-containing protein [Pirellulales bacterium]